MPLRVDPVRTAMYTVITFLATILFTVETPATGGYFNLGEAAIYTIAVVSPSPLMAAIASGLGPAMADLVLGYWYFAPATLAIKFVEGYTVASLVGWLRRRPTSQGLGVAVLAGGVLIAGIVAYRGVTASGGGLDVILYTQNFKVLGITIPLPSITLEAPPALWLLVSLGILVVSGATYRALRSRPYAIAMAAGGVLMVTGYFLYEFFISNPLILGKEPVLALAEIPINVGQMAAGIVISYPVVRFIERAVPPRG